MLTTREIAVELTHELAHWDGKLPSTLRALFTRPGFLTAEILSGRRVRWLSPLRVYLLCCLVFFAAKPLLEISTGRSPRQYMEIEMDATPGQALTAEQRQRIAEAPPGRILGVDRIERAFVRGRDFSREAESAVPKAMFVLLPIFAWLTRMAWRKQNPLYAAHVIAALHIHAAVFGAMAVFWAIATLIPSDAVAFVAYLGLLGYMGWYGLTAFRRLYGESWSRTIVKALLIAVPYWVILMFTLATILAITVLTS